MKGKPGGESRHPCTVLATQRVRPERTAEFLRAQEEISTAMARFPGFLGKELIRPVSGLQEEWVSVFRFSSPASLQHWLESSERRTAAGALDLCAEGPGSWQVVAGEDEETPPVAVVYSHRVKSGAEVAFRAWRADVLREMGAWPGFLGAEVSDPRPGVQNDFVLVARFASAASFEGWMGSARRASYLARLEPLVEGHTVRPLGSGLGGWFAFGDAPAAPSEPPRWKQILMVTLGLYPTVMLLAWFVDPWLARRVPFPVQMLLGNLVCVSLLTWPIMPWLNRRFAPWLAARGRPAFNFLGALAIAVLLLLWLALFLVAWVRRG